MCGVVKMLMVVFGGCWVWCSGVVLVGVVVDLFFMLVVVID